MVMSSAVLIIFVFVHSLKAADQNALDILELCSH